MPELDPVMPKSAPQPAKNGAPSRDTTVGNELTTSMSRRYTKLQTASDIEREMMKKSRLGDVATSSCFQNLTLFIIVLNAIWIFVDVEWNHAHLKGPDGQLPLQTASVVIEHIFCSYFTLEIVIRAFAFKTCWFMCTNAWFIFDAGLLLLMVVETWLLPIVQLAANLDGGFASSSLTSFRLLRLLRLTRMARIMRFFPELMTLVKGMVRAMQSVIFILLFLVIVTYIFAIIFTSQLGDPSTMPASPDEDPNAKQLFSDLGSSMMTLFTHGVLGDNLAWALITIKTENLILFWVFLLFMMMSGITLLNMLIGVLCQVIDDSSREEAEMRQIVELKTCLEEAFSAMDVSADGSISEEEFKEMRKDPKVLKFLFKLAGDSKVMEDRLDQMQECIFGVKDNVEAEIAEVADLSCTTADPSMPLTPEIVQKRRKSLSFEYFSDQVIDLHMDATCGALDVELLKSKMQLLDKSIARRLDQLEPELRRLAAEVAGKSEEASPKAGLEPPQDFHVSPPDEPMATLPGQTEGEDDASQAKTFITEDGFELRADWLQQVPSELLFYVLKSRALPGFMS